MDATTLPRAFGLALLGMIGGTATSAQNPVHAHIGHAAIAFGDTPGGQGLLPTALQEAEIAAQHTALASADPENLDGMRRHAGHALHALDPSVVPGGPGLGYGVKQGATGAALHVGMVIGPDGASENVTVHTAHIATALANVTQWTDEAIALAQRLQSAASVASAASLVTQLDAVCHSIVYGRDADGDGRVGWQEGEGGLAQATQHMNLMRRGEGL
jgi:hypothetical protein